MQKVIYPGSFDPITLGHLDIIKRCEQLFDEVVVLIANNPSKVCTFNVEERIQIIKESLKEMGLKHTVVDTTSGLVTTYCQEHNINIMIRGLRNINDYENEYSRFFYNKNINNNIETILLFPQSRNNFISSSAIKELASQNVDTSMYLPNAASKAIKIKFNNSK